MYESYCFCAVRTLTTFQTSLCIKELENEIPQLVPPTLGIVCPATLADVFMMGCFAWFCCKQGGGVDQRRKAGFEFLLACEQSSGSMWFQLHSGLFPVGFQLFSSNLTTCQKYWSFSWRRRGPQTFANSWTGANIDAHAGFLLSGALLEHTMPRGTFHADVSALKQKNRGSLLFGTLCCT